MNFSCMSLISSLVCVYIVNDGQPGLLMFCFGHDAGATPRGSEWRSSGSVLSARLLQKQKFGRLQRKFGRVRCMHLPTRGMNG